MYSNGIDRVGPTGVPGSKPTDPVRRTDAAENEQTSKAAKAASSGVDRASISADAAEVARYQEMAELHREAYGDVDRSGKLSEVRARIASGHYDKPEVLDAIAGKLTDESISAPAQGDVNVVRERAQSGFYDRPEVVDKTAENMVRSVLPNRDE
ncbi:hypothetical protein KQI52_00305 [bacterium]|nr:hypothetical protein [bacterium]